MSNPITVLVVEENPEIRATIAEYLRSQKFVVHEASSLDTAVKIWGRGGINAAVVDQTAGGMMGIDLIEDFYSSIEDAGSFCAILTSPSPLSADVAARIGALGSANSLVKPFQLRVLRDTLLENLGLPSHFSIPPVDPGEDSGGLLVYRRKKLPRKGYTSEFPMAELVHHLFADQFTGIMELEYEQGNKQVYFNNGLPVFAESDIIDETLGAYLVKKGLISQEQNLQLLDIMKKTGARQGEILINNQMMNPHEMFAHLEAHIIEKIELSFGLKNAFFVLKPGDEWIHSIVPAGIKTGRLILDGVLNYTPLEDVRAALELNDTDVAYLLADQIYTDDQLRLFPAEVKLRRSIQNGKSIGDLLSGDGERALKILYAFYLMQVIGFERVPEKAADDAGSDESHPEQETVEVPQSVRSETRLTEEAQARLADYLRLRDADFYELLEVKQDSPVEEIESGYNKQRKKFHPDSLVNINSSLIQEKLKEMYFKIEEAWKTLSDPKEREKYDKKIRILGKKSQAEASSHPPSSSPVQRRRKISMKPSAKELSRFPAQWLFSRGRTLMKEENYGDAIDHLRISYEKEPGSRCKAFLAWALFLKDPDGAREEAERMLEEIHADDHEDAMSLYIHGKICIQLGENDIAVNYFENSLEIDPNNVDAARQIRYLASKKKSSAGPGGSLLDRDLGAVVKNLFRKK